jgi:hypothetical protein
MPIASINTPNQQALTYTARASEECSTGISQNDTSQMNAASADLTTAGLIRQVTSQITALNKQS